MSNAGPQSAVVRFDLPDLASMRKFGYFLGTLLKSGDVVALNGDLGAGKTTLTQAIASGLRIKDDVTSPTFTLIQEYSGKIPMFHIDPYRLTDNSEMYDIGLEDYFERDGIIVIEWADKILDFLPDKRLNICIDIPAHSDTEEQRILTLEGEGELYITLVNPLEKKYPEIAQRRTARANS